MKITQANLLQIYDLIIRDEMDLQTAISAFVDDNGTPMGESRDVYESQLEQEFLKEYGYNYDE